MRPTPLRVLVQEVEASSANEAGHSRRGLANLVRTIEHLIKPIRVWVNPEHTVESALILMRGHRLSGIPVYDGQQVVGLLEAHQLLGADLNASVHTVMQTEIPLFSPKAPLMTVADWLATHQNTILPIVEEGKLVGMLSVFDLLSEVGRSYDPMTGLPWSDYLREWSMERLAEGKEITILFFDLDNFGLFNKRYGHLVGDEILRRVAQVFREELNPDIEVVCRWGGDEFAVSTLRRREEAGLLAHQISRQISAIRLPQADQPITVSYGYQGGKRTREREQVHLAATVDNLVNLASQDCLLMKGTGAVRPGAQLTLPMQAAVEPRPAERRIRIQSVSYEREGKRARARVYLHYENRVLEGQAEGEAKMHSVVAEATLNAVASLLPTTVRLSLLEVSESSSETGQVVVIALLRWENGETRQELVGSALLRGDVSRSVVSAILDALNRPLARLLERS